MIVIGTDSETHLIKPGLLAPPPVCLTRAYGDVRAVTREIFDRVDGLEQLRQQLADPFLLTTIHNAPYDMACFAAEDPTLLPLIFAAYRAGRLVCTVSRQKVIDVALGQRKWRRTVYSDGRVVVTKAGYTLKELIKIYRGRELEKEDTWRLRYALLDGIPVEQWPAEAREYAMNDAFEHLDLWYAQRDEMREHWGGDLPNLIETQMAAWALHLMSCWGVRADPAAVERFTSNCEHEIDKMRAALADTGILKPDGSRTMAEIRRRVIESLERLQIPVPRTDPSPRFPEGQVQTDKEALELTDDPALHVLAESMTFSKHLDQWGPVVREAIWRPVCARYNELVDTGRTSCSSQQNGDGTNFQNPPRKGDVRPCFVPRKGWVYVSTDADTIELRAHAQNCLEIVGWSKMAEALLDQARNKGPDLHLRLAAQLLKLDPYEALARMRDGDPEVAEARQFAKVPNFGYPGGLGARTMIAYAAAQMSREQHQKRFGSNPEDQLRESKRIRDVWFETWPENKPYFDYCASLVDEATGEGTIAQRMSGRLRGGARFTAIANGFFQGRVADAMKEAVVNLAEECYTGRCTSCDALSRGLNDVCRACGGRPSVLWGSRPVMFLHDEPIVEHPHDATLTARATRQRDVVVEALTRWMPDIPCTSTAVAMLRWQKGAEPVYRDGLLVPSRPFKTPEGKTKWVEDA